MSTTTDDVTVPAQRLRTFAQEALTAMGAPPDIAAEVARHLIEANLSGHDSHGALRLSQYAELAAKGEIVPDARPRALRESPTLALFDACRGFGQWSTRQTLQWCMSAAERNGIGAATIRHSMHAGRLGDYAERACERGLVAIVCLGVAGEGAGRVTPFRGRQGFLGTNPWAIGVPAEGRAPLIVDFATSAMAEGKLRVYRARGQQLPPGIVLTADGSPSTEPGAFYEGGSLTPVGGEQAGHKGYGLGLAAAMLGALGMIGDDAPTAAGAMSARIASTYAAGVFMVVLSPEWFGGTSAYQALAGAVLEAAPSVPPTPGTDRVLVPGEPEARSRAERTRDGVPVPGAIRRQLDEMGERLGIGPLA